AHLQNFGLFATPERNLVFDANDFDETLAGPWEWDLKRLAASVELACREGGFAGSDRRACVLDVLRAYRGAMAEFAALRNLEVWYAHMDAETAMNEYRRLLEPKLLKRKKKAIAKARKRDSVHAFERLTHIVAGERHILNQPPLLVPHRELLGAAERDQLEHEIEEMTARCPATPAYHPQTL